MTVVPGAEPDPRAAATVPAGGVPPPAHELEAAPSVPAEAREDLLALKSEAVFLCARRDGDMRPGRASGEGLYADDTRHLSELRLTVGGHLPVLLSSVMDSGHHAVVNATNPTLEGAAPVPQETLNVRRTILVADRLHYGIRLANYHRATAAATVTLVLAADFADVFEVRGVGRRTSGALLPAASTADGVRFAYEAADGECRETHVSVGRPPTRLGLDGSRATLEWELELAPGESLTLPVTVIPARPARPAATAAPSLGEAAARLGAEHEEWVGACARISTDNELFDRFIDASVRDLHALMMPAPGGRLPAAGIPWYVAPFGRDSLLTATEALLLDPEIARGTLLVLAGLQARAEEPWRDAEPGKILHELRTGELARTGHIPHTPYYGTVDATPLFLMLASEYHRWTLDLETLAALRPALDAALAWIDATANEDGFVTYARRSPAGLHNHGWKDSDDSIVHADGTLARGPIALVEVQAYVYAAKQRIADVYDALDLRARADRLRDEAAALRLAFADAFWDADEAFPVLALDGHGQQVRSVSSNAAHCLYCGILDADRAALVAERLMAPDMFSGWGIRTLSSRSPAYNPMSYHNGSVWPHDNAIAAAGLKRYGFAAAAGRIMSAMFDVAGGARDHRLPELFCGFEREQSRSVIAYPVACIPQAWAAAAPFLLLQSVLGIDADAPAARLTVDRPHLPDWLRRVDVDDLRVGPARLGLSFRRTGTGTTAFSLLRQQGEVRVTMSA